MKILKTVWLVAVLLLLANCGGPGLYETAYRPSNNSLSGAVFLQKNQKPQLIRTANLQEQVNAYIDDDYVIVGVSSFSGPLQDTDDAVKKAEKLGVTHILLSSSFGYDATKKAYKYQDNYEYRPYVKDMGGYYGVAFDRIPDPIAIPYRKNVEIHVQRAVFLVKRQ